MRTKTDEIFTILKDMTALELNSFCNKITSDVGDVITGIIDHYANKKYNLVLTSVSPKVLQTIKFIRDNIKGPDNVVMGLKECKDLVDDVRGTYVNFAGAPLRCKATPRIIISHIDQHYARELADKLYEETGSIANIIPIED